VLGHHCVANSVDCECLGRYRAAGIDERDALALHNRLLALHGGAGGLRDRGLLQSALGADIIDMATAYTAGILRNHPFLDGNKRTGFLVGILFLELNGYRFVASEEDAAQAVLKLADSKLDEADYSSFLRGNVVRRKK